MKQHPITSSSSPQQLSPKQTKGPLSPKPVHRAGEDMMFSPVMPISSHKRKERKAGAPRNLSPIREGTQNSFSANKFAVSPKRKARADRSERKSPTQLTSMKATERAFPQKKIKAMFNSSGKYGSNISSMASPPPDPNEQYMYIANKNKLEQDRQLRYFLQKKAMNEARLLQKLSKFLVLQSPQKGNQPNVEQVDSSQDHPLDFLNQAEIKMPNQSQLKVAKKQYRQTQANSRITRASPQQEEVSLPEIEGRTTHLRIPSNTNMRNIMHASINEEINDRDDTYFMSHGQPNPLSSNSNSAEKDPAKKSGFRMNLNYKNSIQSSMNNYSPDTIKNPDDSPKQQMRKTQDNNFNFSSLNNTLKRKTKPIGHHQPSDHFNSRNDNRSDRNLGLISPSGPKKKDLENLQAKLQNDQRLVELPSKLKAKKTTPLEQQFSVVERQRNVNNHLNNTEMSSYLSMMHSSEHVDIDEKNQTNLSVVFKQSPRYQQPQPIPHLVSLVGGASANYDEKSPSGSIDMSLLTRTRLGAKQLEMSKVQATQNSQSVDGPQGLNQMITESQLTGEGKTRTFSPLPAESSQAGRNKGDDTLISRRESDESPQHQSNFQRSPSKLKIRGKRLKQVPFSKDPSGSNDMVTFYRDDEFPLGSTGRKNQDHVRTLQNSEINFKAGRESYRSSKNNSQLQSHGRQQNTRYRLVSPMRNGLPVLPNGVHIVQKLSPEEKRSRLRHQTLNRNSTLNFDFQKQNQTLQDFSTVTHSLSLHKEDSNMNSAKKINMKELLRDKVKLKEFLETEKKRQSKSPRVIVQPPPQGGFYAKTKLDKTFFITSDPKKANFRLDKVAQSVDAPGSQMLSKQSSKVLAQTKSEENSQGFILYDANGNHTKRAMASDTSSGDLDPNSMNADLNHLENSGKPFDTLPSINRLPGATSGSLGSITGGKSGYILDFESLQLNKEEFDHLRINGKKKKMEHRLMRPEDTKHIKIASGTSAMEMHPSGKETTEVSTSQMEQLPASPKVPRYLQPTMKQKFNQKDLPKVTDSELEHYWLDQKMRALVTSLKDKPEDHNIQKILRALHPVNSKDPQLQSYIIQSIQIQNTEDTHMAMSSGGQTLQNHEAALQEKNYHRMLLDGRSSVDMSQFVSTHSNGFTEQFHTATMLPKIGMETRKKVFFDRPPMPETNSRHVKINKMSLNVLLNKESEQKKTRDFKSLMNNKRYVKKLTMTK